MYFKNIIFLFTNIFYNFLYTIIFGIFYYLFGAKISRHISIIFDIIPALMFMLIISIIIFKEANLYKLSKLKWSIGTLMVPLLVPIYIVKTRSQINAWKLIVFFIISFILFNFIWKFILMHFG
jgi:hypothetical protein